MEQTHLATWGLEPCLLTTDTGEAGSSPHVARCFFFQWGSLTKYCTIYNWHLTPLLKFSMQLTLQSKWSGASDATRLTLSVWYSVPDAARKTYLKFQVSCKYQNEWLIIPFSTEWVNQTFFHPNSFTSMTSRISLTDDSELIVHNEVPVQLPMNNLAKSQWHLTDNRH